MTRDADRTVTFHPTDEGHLAARLDGHALIAFPARMVAFDPEHDEPINLSISRTGITVDSDRGEEFLKHYDLKRCNAMENFVHQMAGMSLPEEEWKDAGCVDVDDFVSNLDDDRLCSECETLMDVVRSARQFMK